MRPRHGRPQAAQLAQPLITHIPPLRDEVGHHLVMNKHLKFSGGGCQYRKIGSRPLKASGTSSKGTESISTCHATCLTGCPTWCIYWDNSWQVFQDDAIRKNPDKTGGTCKNDTCHNFALDHVQREARVVVRNARRGKIEFFLFPGHDASSFGRLVKRVAGCNFADLRSLVAEEMKGPVSVDWSSASLGATLQTCGAWWPRK